jgi:hypothetical protein
MIAGTAALIGLTVFILAMAFTSPRDEGARTIANVVAIALVLPGIAVFLLALATRGR